MGYPSWQTARRETIQYQSRRPTESNLYRLVFYYHEQLERAWEERFQQHYGFLRQEVKDAFLKYLDCGILAHGCARAYCENCKHSTLIAFSCKRRAICPSCAAKRAVIFAEHLHQEVLLPHQHRHVIFTIPKRLRVFFRYDRSLLKHLYAAAWITWKEFVAEQLPGGSTGAIMALHSAGDLLNWHPHVHTFALHGAVLDDGHFLSLAGVDTDGMTSRFQELVFQALFDEELIDQDTVDNMKSWEHSGFQVYAGEPISGTDENARRFLARYLKKSPLSLERIHIKDTLPEPVVAYFKQRDDGYDRYRTFSPLEFLAELQQHIPDMWEQTVRYVGCYSSRTRGAEARKKRLAESLKQQQELLPLPEIEPAPAPSKTWAACMKRVFEIDPLQCPRCSSEMKIIAFIQDQKAIKNIAASLGLVTWRAPPPFAEKSGFGEGVVSALKSRLDHSTEYSQIH